MLFGLFFGDWTILIVLPGFLFALFAQAKVRSAYESGARVSMPYGMTGGALARRLLDANGLSDVRIERVPGTLSDHYDPRERVLRLSEGVFSGCNAAAVGVAAHEAGHAMQDARGYVPLKLRLVLVPVTNFGSRLAMPLFLIGLLFTAFLRVSTPIASWLMLAGIAAFALSVVFQLVTLPVEFNASRRALRCLAGSGTMDEEQLFAARRVLSAAALTYVAALATGLLSLLRLLLIFASVSSRRR